MHKMHTSRCENYRPMANSEQKANTERAGVKSTAGSANPRAFHGWGRNFSLCHSATLPLPLACEPAKFDDCDRANPCLLQYKLSPTHAPQPHSKVRGTVGLQTDRIHLTSSSLKSL